MNEQFKFVKATRGLTNAARLDEVKRFKDYLEYLERDSLEMIEMPNLDYTYEQMQGMIETLSILIKYAEHRINVLQALLK